MLIRLGLNDIDEPPNPGGESAVPPPEGASAEVFSPGPDQAEELEAALRALEQTIPGLEVAAPAPAMEPVDFDVPEMADTGAPGVPDSVPEAVVYWLACYGRNPSEATRNLRELAARAPEVTADALLPQFEAGACGRATALVVSLLATNARAVQRLCDPEAPMEASVNLALSLSKQDPRFYTTLAKNLLLDNETSDDAVRRGFTILEQLGSPGRLIPILIQYLRHSDARVRARAAFGMGRLVPTRNLMAQVMKDENARVRADFVEGLWGSRANQGELFRLALRDPHQRVVGNAVVGLHRVGQSRDVVQQVARMARNSEASFRATAAWVMGQTGEDRYSNVLRQMLHDQDPGVRRNALISLRRIRTAQMPSPAPPVAEDRSA